MELYTYALVHIKGMSIGYNYISDDGNIKVGSYVLVPFGKGNEEKPGEVVDIHECTAEDAPFPVEKTKHILRSLTADEYESMEAQIPEAGPLYGWSDDEDIEEMENYLRTEKEYNYDYIFDWASYHHENEPSKRMMKLIIHCYTLCAEQHMPVACLNLGALYYNGVYVPQDYKKAAALYKIAADNGIQEGIRNLGYCYYYGRHQASDFNKAFAYFTKGALLFEDANCLYKLGDMYRMGEAAEKNEKYAYILYERAMQKAKADERFDYCKADIFYRLGFCRFKGIGTTVDVEEAHHDFQKALDGFYARRKTDPFAKDLIEKTKKQLRLTEEILDQEIL